MDEILELIKGFLKCMEDEDNYEQRKVARDPAAGLVISTAYTSDHGYETAIIDKNGAYTVERYSDKENALLGHKKWCKEVETITQIKSLIGWGKISEEIVTLNRYEY